MIIENDFLSSTWLDIEEVSKILHISPYTLYKYAKTNTLPSRKVGKYLYFSTNGINDFLNEGIYNDREFKVRTY